MTRVSPSIAERCRIFSNGAAEENEGPFKRLFYQDGTTQTASGIPVPISNMRREPQHLQSNAYVQNAHPSDASGLSLKQVKENEFQRVQRKLRARWETPSASSK
ncbi:hypothetical protein FHG87_010467, partial [Trinorchestia longiramus]